VTQEPQVFVQWYELTQWLLGRTEKFPKRIRHTFSVRIENLALDVLQELAAVRYARKKAETLAEINEKIDMLRILLRLCNDMRYLDHKGYEHAARRIDEAGRMLGGWRRGEEGKGA
jgi:hypothetical protein